jgi:Phage integrase, N-terminal SAM-like domain.
MTEDLRIRNYAPKTIERYVAVLVQTSNHCNLSPDLLTPELVRKYLVSLVQKKMSPSTLKQVVCAVRFFFRQTLGGLSDPSHTFPTLGIAAPRDPEPTRGHRAGERDQQPEALHPTDHDLRHGSPGF